MRLLPLDHWATIFDPLKGLRVGVVDGIGNVGDTLLYAATRQMLDHWGIAHTTVAPLVERVDPSKYDKLLLFAGGNLGDPPCTAIRQAAIETRIPCWVLPQSALLFEEQPWERVFIRESRSRAILARGEIVPDLALGYDFPEPTTTERIPHGLFLRRYGSALFGDVGAVDPAECCHTVRAYCDLAARYAAITTDRLHFAITALGMGCSVTLLPVDYHKNAAMYAEYLEALGCRWKDSP